MESLRFEQYSRLAAVALLMLGCFYVLQPFLGAILFAGVLCFSTWPLFVRLQGQVGGRSWLAALILVFVMILALALPVALAAQSLIVHSADIVERVRSFISNRTTIELPQFVQHIPMVGPWLNDYWQILMQSRDELLALARRMVDPAKAMLVAMGASVGQGLVQVLIAIFVAYFFYRDGERVRALLLEGMGRLAGPRLGARIVSITQSSVKGVVYGLLGTAFAQALVAVIGFLIAGVPGAFLLGALTFILSLVPMGPVFAWGGAAAWLYFSDQPGWAIFMVIYGVAVISSVDNFVKPILMSRAGGLSMLLIVLGVFGGAVAFGFIGLFLGPALLAVGWNLIKVWLEPAVEPEAAGDETPP
jgi:predicted PurR-regulated permease PerM